LPPVVAVAASTTLLILYPIFPRTKDSLAEHGRLATLESEVFLVLHQQLILGGGDHAICQLIALFLVYLCPGARRSLQQLVEVGVICCAVT